MRVQIVYTDKATCPECQTSVAAHSLNYGHKKYCKTQKPDPVIEQSEVGHYMNQRSEPVHSGILNVGQH